VLRFAHRLNPMSDPAILPNPSSPNVYGPMTVGQMFERTFALLRENFKLFFGIVLILIGVEIVIGGILIGFSGGTAVWMGRSATDAVPMARLLMARLFFIAPVFVVGAILLFVLVQIIQGALFIATQAKLVQAPMTVGEACRFAMDKAGRLVGISLLILVRVVGYILLFVTGAAIVWGVFALFAGLAPVSGVSPFHFWHQSLPGLGIFILVPFCLLVLYLLFWLWLVARYSLSIPATLAENLSITESIRRSIHLSHGSRGRLYALLVGMIGVDIAVAAVTLPLQLLLHHGHNMHARAAFGAVGLLFALVRLLVYAFVMAFMGIATALCYYDLRVRKEGFGVVVPPPPPPMPLPPAEGWSLPPAEPTGDLPVS
jgi:hypothetical protein